MRLDFTPRKFMAPQTPEEAAKLIQDTKTLVDLYMQVDRLSRNQAENLAEAQVKAGNLNNELKRLQKNLDDLVFNSDYLYRSFQDTTAELRNQNILLKLGKSAFSDLTNQAQKLTNFQQGYSDLQEKDFKKIKESYQVQKKEIDYIVDNLSKNEDFRKRELVRLSSIEEAGGRLSKIEKERLNTLAKEQGLLEASRDAQEGGLKLLEKELDLSKQIFKARRDLGGLANATASVISKFGGGLAQYLDITEATEAVNEFNQKLINDRLKEKDVIEAIQKIEDDKLAILQESLDAAKAVRETELEISLAKSAQVELDRLRNDELQKSNELISIGLQATRLINELNASINDQSTEALQRRTEILDELNNLSDRESEILTEQADIATKILDTTKQIKDVNVLNNKLTQQKIDLARTDEQINSKLAAKEQEAYDIKQKAIAETSTGLTGLKNKFASLGVLINNSFGGLKKLLTDPVVLITTLVDIGFKANTQAVELGKSLGISAVAAGKLREEAAEYARETNDAFVNTDRLLKAQSELSKELGIAVKFSNEELVTFSKLTELTGLTTQEAGKLVLASKAANMSAGDYTDSVREAAFYAQQSTGTHFESKEILQDVAKLSAGILIKFQNNPKAIGQAVIEAKKLGLTLEQIDKVGESLLNWESSIENELKAELLTGKELNMEKARAAALSGDQLTLTKEIANQVGSLEDYQNMNVIAQRSLAEAFGLSRDEMSEMLLKQAAINDYGADAAKLNKDQLEDMKRQGLSASEYLKKQEQQQTAQQKFQDALVKLQTIFSNLVDGPVGQLLDAIADLSGAVVGILKIFSPIFTVVSAIAKIIIGAISGPIKFIADSVTTVTNGISTAIDFVIAGFDKIKSAVAPFFSAIGSFFAPIASFLSPIFSFVASIGKGLATWVVGFTAISLASGFVISKLISGLGRVTASLFTSTAATTTNTTATTANATANRLNATQLSAYNALRAANVSATQAITAARAIQTGTTTANTASVNANTVSNNANTVASGRNRLATIANNIVTVISTGLQYAWNVAKGLGLAIMNSGLVTWLAEKAAIIGHTIATNASSLASGAWNLIAGAGNLLRKTAIGQWLAEKAAIVVSTIAKWANVGATAAQAETNTILAGSQTTVGATSTAASGGLVAFGRALGSFGAAAAPAIPVILALGAALLLATPAIYVLGEVIKSIAVVIGNVLMKALEMLPAIIDSVAKGFVTVFSTLAANWQILIPVGIGLMSIAGGMTLLGIASTIAFPGLLLGAAGLSALSAGLFVLSLAKDNVDKIAESIKKLGDIDATNLAALGPALIGVGVGLASLGVGGVINAIGDFLGGDPIKKIEQLAASGKGLQQTATSLQITSTAITQLNASLASLDVSKLLFIGPALAMVGDGLRSLNGGGIGDIFSSLLVGDPIEKLERLVAIGDRFKDLPSVFQTVVSSITQLNTSLASLDVSKLDAIGPALTNIGVGLASLGTGGVIEAIGSFFTGDPAEKIASIAASGEGLQQTATSLQTTSTAIIQLNTSLASLDVSKLFSIGPALMMIGEGLKSLNGGGITDTLSSLLAGDPIEKLERLATIGNKLKDLPSVFQTVVSSVVQLNASLASLDVSKLDAIGPAITKIGIGLAALGGGNVIDSISSLFAGDPIEKLNQLAATGDGLQKTSTALQIISAAIIQLNTSIASLDVSKLDAIGPALMMIENGLKSLNSGGITNIFASFLTGDPIEKLKSLATVGDKLKDLPPIFQTIMSSITQLNTSIALLDVSKLDAIGPALAKIGIGLASLGGGNIVNAISSFLVGDPIKKLEQLATVGDKLQVTANALQSIASSLMLVSTALATVDTSKLESLSEFEPNQSSKSIFDSITDFISSPIKTTNETSFTPTPIKTINETIEGKKEKEKSIEAPTINAGGIDITPMVNAISEIKLAIATLQNRPVKLYVDSREITMRQLQANNSI